jgi:hypothetical protein
MMSQLRLSCFRFMLAEMALLPTTSIIMIRHAILAAAVAEWYDGPRQSQVW